MRKPWKGVDLDGTVARHYWPEDGPYDPLRIGEPIPEMVQRIQGWIMDGWEVRIFTARVGPNGSAPPEVIPDGEDVEQIRAAIRAWTLRHIGVALEATCTKDYGMVELWDDRAVRVLHNAGVTCCNTDTPCE